MHQIQQDIGALTTDLVVTRHDSHIEDKKTLFPRGPALVVLFIDDLDRCPPDKVVEMLEAIQILIKTPLFIVVMAIDVRFITRALEKAYANILTRGGDPSGLDYIEKIIQIPYRMRPISSDAVHSYLEAQMSVVRPQAQPGEGEPGGAAAGTAQQPGGQPAAPREAEPMSEALPIRAIEFSEEEFDYVLRCCSHIDLTPRAAKRLINVCKTLKIVWFRPNQHQEPGPEVKQAVILLLALSGRYPDLMRHMFEALDAQVKQSARDARATPERKLVELFHANPCGQDAHTQREYNRLLEDVDELMSHDLTVGEIPSSILDLVRSFSFVGDVGYTPGEYELVPTGAGVAESGPSELAVAWPQLLQRFGQEMERRLAQEMPTAEDTVRCAFYLELIAVGIRAEAMILERPHPHPQLQQKEIDLSVIRPGGMWDFEVKYHRPIHSGRNRPLTQLRGQVVSDFYKLALSDGQQRYLLYVADLEMAAHWERQMEMLMQATRTSPARLTSEWLAKQPKTLKSTVRSGLGFLPEQVEPNAWVEATWSGSKVTVQLFGIKE